MLSEPDDFDVADLAVPGPGALIQSLRAVGYDLSTAVADLVDNSISAGARCVWVEFHWHGQQSVVTVTDDGHGMDEGELVRAMRLGSISPLEPRQPRDLGRFGMGLKTASFSQCKRLTVASRREGTPLAIRCWDLQFVTDRDEWRLLREGYPGVRDCFTCVGDAASGTVVAWEQIDRLVEGAGDDSERDRRLFAEHIARVETHLAMVFHRFLERPNPIQILVNGQPVSPWDPFLRREEATQLLTEETLYLCGMPVVVRPYVLPHHSRLSSEAHANAAGPKGWNAAQGFYVYRNDRLLMDGDWLGLGFHKEEHYKLARISLDFPSALDSLWAIDVKKSRSRPPAAVRDDLRRIARLTRSRASEIYRHRGKLLTRRHGGDQVLLWGRKVREGRISYVINRDHPLVHEVLRGQTDRRRPEALLRLLEETVPVPLVVIDHAEQPDQHLEPFEAAPSGDLKEVMRQVYLALVSEGLRPSDARARLGALEPFDRFPELVAAMQEEQ